MPISAADCINPAFHHAKQQLFRPFRFSQWARLALVGLLAGELGSGGFHSNFNFPVTPRQSSHPLSTTLVSPQFAYPHFTATMIASLLVIGFGLMVLFIYINSRMRFILFDSIIAKECHIRAGWRGRRQEGLRLFVWQLQLSLVSFVGIAVFIGVPLLCVWLLGWLANPRENVLALVAAGLLTFSVFFIFIALLMLIHVMTKDFVVPQMALENIGAMEGWRRLWVWLKAEKGGYAGYVGMKVVLAIGAGMATGIVTIIVILLLFVPLGALGVFTILLGKVVGLTWNFYTIGLVVLTACVAFFLLMTVISFISVPVIVFFPAYSIYFFAPRYLRLANLLWPQAPASVEATLPSPAPELGT